jgi:hypothetical protein
MSGRVERGKAEKSRRDDTLLTVCFNLRRRDNASLSQSPARTTLDN